MINELQEELLSAAILHYIDSGESPQMALKIASEYYCQLSDKQKKKIAIEINYHLGNNIIPIKSRKPALPYFIPWDNLARIFDKDTHRLAVLRDGRMKEAVVEMLRCKPDEEQGKSNLVTRVLDLELTLETKKFVIIPEEEIKELNPIQQ